MFGGDETVFSREMYISEELFREALRRAGEQDE
jgi:hypothetical protein